MSELFLGLMMLCSPFDVQTPMGVPVQQNCVHVDTEIVDRSLSRVLENETDLIVRGVMQHATSIVVAQYYFRDKPCQPTVHYGQQRRADGGLVVLLHPNVIRDRDEATLFKAFELARLRWHSPFSADYAIFYGCSN